MRKGSQDGPQRAEPAAGRRAAVTRKPSETTRNPLWNQLATRVQPRSNPPSAAARGVAGSGGRLPHLEAIQSAFGAHDVTAIRSHTGPEAAAACQALGAQGYATGQDVALARPTLFNAAHEAAHVVQQRGGVQLRDGVGRARDVHEQHADAVAAAVVAGRSAERLLDATPGSGGVTAGAAPVQFKEDDESAAPAAKSQAATDDLDAILRAGQRERDNPPERAQTMANGASIVYRILRVFHPEISQRWWISGVGGSASVTGLKLERSGAKNVSITVGRDFILQTDERRLQDRVNDVARAFQSLDANAKDPGTQTTTAASVDLAGAIEEGGKLFADKAEFGVTAGSQAGPDAGDGYDARYWKEEGRALVSIVEPWLAMSLLVQYLGGPIPTVDGRQTRWHFDCFEGMEVVRKYAEWRTVSRSEFNRRNSPLRLGFMAYLRQGAADLEKAIRADSAKGKPYLLGEEKAVMKGGIMAFEPERIPAGTSMAQVLEEAPVGSWICWTNADVTARLLAHEKLKTSGRPIGTAQQEFIDRIKPWENENALKIGRDRYSAFPFGVVTAAEIMQGMAEIVHKPNPVPAGYIAKYIYLSTIAKKK